MEKCEYCAKLGRVSFLQGHYNRFRDAGGGHGMYIVYNDLSDKTAKELLDNYASTHPPVPAEKTKEFMEKLKEENARAKQRDDLHWLTGTGPYGQ